MAFLAPLPVLPQPHPRRRHPRRRHARPTPSTPSHTPKSSLSELSETSLPLPTPTTQPPHPPTTIYHLLPAPVPYLPPPAHPNDADTKILALTLSHATHPWLRARYLRTKPLILESRARKRVYRGLHGTPAAPGPAAPTKPRLSPSAVAAFNAGLVVALRGLPLKVSPRDLVTFGETALGDVLAEQPANSRGNELVQVVYHHRTPWVLALARLPSRGVRSSFVLECPGHTRRVRELPMHAREMGVFAEGVCVLGWRVPGVGGVKGLFTGLFGGQERLMVDVASGTDFVFLTREGDSVWQGRLEGLLSGILLEDIPGGVRVTGKRVIAQEISVTTVEDVRSGVAFENGGRRGDGGSGGERVESRIVQFDVTANGVGEVTVLGDDNVAVMEVVKVYDYGQACIPIYLGYNRQTNTPGIHDIHGAHWDAPTGARLSGPLYSPDHTHVSVLQTGTDPKLLFFQSDDLTTGPVCEIPLEGLGDVHTSVAGAWTDFSYEWSEENARIAKSAYELFAEKNWNDIESGFSSLGLRL